MTSTLSLAAGTVAYDERGSGPKVVLLPSGGHDRSDYDELRARLDGVTTIAMDWPGHGDAPAPTQPGSVTAWADVAEQFVAHVAPEGAIVAGNSIGGFSAGRLAARRPELVAGLAIIDGGGWDPPNVAAKTFCALMGRRRFLAAIYPRFSATYMRARTDADRRARQRAIANTRKPETLRSLSGLWASFPTAAHDLTQRPITVPTTIIWGLHDPVIPVAVGRRAAQQISGAALVEVDAGHAPHTTDPDAVARALQALATRAHGRDR